MQDTEYLSWGLLFLMLGMKKESIKWLNKIKKGTNQSNQNSITEVQELTKIAKKYEPFKINPVSPLCQYK